MAIAMRCDRCGSYYEGNKQHETIGRIKGGRLAGVMTVSRIGFDQSFDLCDGCISEFLTFMRMEVAGNDCK